RRAPPSDSIGRPPGSPRRSCGAPIHQTSASGSASMAGLPIRCYGTRLQEFTALFESAEPLRPRPLRPPIIAKPRRKAMRVTRRFVTFAATRARRAPSLLQVSRLSAQSNEEAAVLQAVD